MTKDTTKEAAVAAKLFFDDWFDGIEDGVRAGCAVSSRRCWKRNFSRRCAPRYGRRRLGEAATPSVVGVRHGHRERTLTGTFGKTRIARAARAVDRRGRQDARMAERFAAPLPAPHRGRQRLIAGAYTQGPIPAACDAR